jgi:prevent-host-death family protein
MHTPVGIKCGAAMHTFTIRDLRDRTAEIVREAEAGKLSLVTKHGQPVFVAVPFDEALLREGVHVALSAHLFSEERLSLGKAARLAGMSPAEFMERLSRLGIPVARPSREELHEEIEALGR